MCMSFFYLLCQSKGEPRPREEKQFILNRCNQQWILSSDELSKSIYDMVEGF